MNCFTEVSSYIKSRHFDKAADLLKVAINLLDMIVFTYKAYIQILLEKSNKC